MPKYNYIYFLIEGNDDKRFFENILKPLFRRKYQKVKLIKHRHRPDKENRKYIQAIKDMGCDLVFFTDIDKAPCNTAKKTNIQNCHSNLNDNEIIIVCKEIESWYLAGFKKLTLKQLKITDNITKGGFKSYKPEGKTEREFYIDIIQNYDLKIARKRNTSLNYLLDKWDL